MATLDDPRTQTVRAIHAWREAQEALQPPRQYLGASSIGHACERYLWLTFRLAGREQFDGRMLRLFDRGQREEATFVAELRGIGCQVHDVDANGQQFGVEAHGGHFRGHMDGAVLGLPESPKTWHVLEFKTHSAKSFKELAAKGVMAAKPMHYAQVQTYMHLTGMTRALYLAVNKDTDDLYEERVEHNAAHAQALIDRAERIIFSAEPPGLLSQDPAWFECKWCHFHGHCHGTAAPAVNCRTCAHSTPTRDGKWFCEHHRQFLHYADHQLLGCPDHRHFPVLLSNWAEMTDASAEANWVKYRSKLNGHEFTNSEGGANDFSSAAITACEDKSRIGELVLTKASFTDAEIPF